jgi:hypothetical protein
MADEPDLFELEQGDHNLGVMLSRVSRKDRAKYESTVYLVDETRAKAMFHGLRRLVRDDHVAHPHTWPWSRKKDL